MEIECHANRQPAHRRAPNPMIFEIGHADIPLSEWEAFRAAPPGDLIEDVIDRSRTELPARFVPNARGGSWIAPARPETRVRTSCGRVGTRLGWIQRFGDLWTVEWLTWVTPQVLVHRTGSTPIVARTSEEALRLAELCTLDPPPGLCWVANMPPEAKLLEFAQRVTYEAQQEHWRSKAA
jgi:hypothetical protein